MNRHPLRLTLAAGGLAAVALAPIAAAAPRPVSCNLVTDARGDAVNATGVPAGAGDDILSADVASNGTTLTGVVRVAGLSAPDPQAPAGRAYFLEFFAPGTTDLLFLAARTPLSGATFTYGYVSDNPVTGTKTTHALGTATGVLDTARGEVRISIPISGYAPTGAKLNRGGRLTDLSSRVARMVTGLPSVDTPTGHRVPLGTHVQYDEAYGRSYVLGARSCAPVGR